MAEHIEREALLRDIERYNVSDGALRTGATWAVD